MLPIGPLMIEHRLIERMIKLVGEEISRIRENIQFSDQFAFVNDQFIDAAVDFMQTYADQVHHGKEEDILFAFLADKALTSEHQQIMRELQEDHKLGRQTVAKLLTTKEDYLSGQMGALNQLLDLLASLVEFYPRHIEKEDKNFFLPVMAYFSPEEKEDMLARMYAFDQEFIHNRYKKVLADWEASGCKCHL